METVANKMDDEKFSTYKSQKAALIESTKEEVTKLSDGLERKVQAYMPNGGGWVVEKSIKDRSGNSIGLYVWCREIGKNKEQTMSEQLLKDVLRIKIDRWRNDYVIECWDDTEDPICHILQNERDIQNGCVIIPAQDSEGVYLKNQGSKWLFLS